MAYKSNHDKLKAELESAGFTQWRYDLGARRGELSNSYRNQDRDLNVILHGQTYTVLRLSTCEELITGRDMLIALRGDKLGRLNLTN